MLFLSGQVIQRWLPVSSFCLFQPVNMFPPTERGFCDVAGNVWDWVEDHFNGLPDFNTHIFYDDYSSPTSDGKHYNILVSVLSMFLPYLLLANIHS